jgi:ascorbate-specific PTS system EIIC-type component UlaA
MFQRAIDDFKESAGNALRLTSLAGVAVIAGFVTILFLCAAAFVFVLQNYGLIEACLTGAAIFFLITLIAVVTYAIRRNAMKKRAAKTAKSAAQNLLADPMLVAAGLQLVRAIGIKKLIPILAVGGLALGLLAGRRDRDDEDDDKVSDNT